MAEQLSRTARFATTILLQRVKAEKFDQQIAVDERGDLLVSVKYSGSGFDPSELPNPIAAENLLAPHGRGIFLIRQLMDEVDFKFDRGTEVRMRRRQKWLE